MCRRGVSHCVLGGEKKAAKNQTSPHLYPLGWAGALQHIHTQLERLAECAAAEELQKRINRSGRWTVKVNRTFISGRPYPCACADYWMLLVQCDSPRKRWRGHIPVGQICQGIISVYSDVFRYSSNFLPEWTCDFLESSSETFFCITTCFLWVREHTDLKNMQFIEKNDENLAKKFGCRKSCFNVVFFSFRSFKTQQTHLNSLKLRKSFKSYTLQK